MRPEQYPEGLGESLHRHLNPPPKRPNPLAVGFAVLLLVIIVAGLIVAWEMLKTGYGL